MCFQNATFVFPLCFSALLPNIFTKFLYCVLANILKNKTASWQSKIFKINEVIAIFVKVSWDRFGATRVGVWLAVSLARRVPQTSALLAPR